MNILFDLEKYKGGKIARDELYHLGISFNRVVLDIRGNHIEFTDCENIPEKLPYYMEIKE